MADEKQRPPSKPALTGAIATVILGNPKVWEWIGRASDIEGVASLVSKVGPLLRTLGLFLRDWGWLFGLAWFAALFLWPPDLWPKGRRKNSQAVGEVTSDDDYMFAGSYSDPFQNAADEVDRLREELKAALAERGAAQAALAATRRAFAQARVRWFAEKGKQNGATAQVTIRFVDYADFALAEQIQKELREVTDWPIRLDGTNDPLLKPSDEYKVVFASGIFGTFHEVAAAFSEGKLIDATIGVRNDENVSPGHLIIEVLPTVNASPWPTMDTHGLSTGRIREV